MLSFWFCAGAVLPLNCAVIPVSVARLSRSRVPAAAPYRVTRFVVAAVREPFGIDAEDIGQGIL